MPKTLDDILRKAKPRMICSSDLQGIAEVERLSFSYPWQVCDFAKCLDRKHCTGLVIEIGGQILAFLIYEVGRRTIKMINMAVRPDVRQQGLGTKLVKKLIAYMLDSECTSLNAEMRETNLNGQLFLQSLGFKATGVVRGYFEDTKEDMYNMVLGLSDIPKTPE